MKKLLETVNKNLEHSTEVLTGLQALIVKLSKIMMAVNIVNIATLIILVILLLTN